MIARRCCSHFLNFFFNFCRFFLIYFVTDTTCYTDFVIYLSQSLSPALINTVISYHRYYQPFTGSYFKKETEWVTEITSYRRRFFWSRPNCGLPITVTMRNISDTVSSKTSCCNISIVILNLLPCNN